MYTHRVQDDKGRWVRVPTTHAQHINAIWDKLVYEAILELGFIWEGFYAYRYRHKEDRDLSLILDLVRINDPQDFSLARHKVFYEALIGNGTLTLDKSFILQDYTMAGALDLIMTEVRRAYALKP